LHRYLTIEELFHEHAVTRPVRASAGANLSRPYVPVRRPVAYRPMGEEVQVK